MSENWVCHVRVPHPNDVTNFVDAVVQSPENGLKVEMGFVLKRELREVSKAKAIYCADELARLLLSGTTVSTYLCALYIC